MYLNSVLFYKFLVQPENQCLVYNYIPIYIPPKAKDPRVLLIRYCRLGIVGAILILVLLALMKFAVI